MNTNIINDLLKHEDSLDTKNRYATLLNCDLNVRDVGYWTILDSITKVWRLNITSENAKALSLFCDTFYIPSNGKLFIYNPQKNIILGAYTSLNNNHFKTFTHEILYGDTLCIEYIQKGDDVFRFNINQLAYSYKSTTFLNFGLPFIPFSS